MRRHFGLSNVYLKVGLVLIAISVLMLATAFFFPSAIRYLSGGCSGLLLARRHSALCHGPYCADHAPARAGLTVHSDRTRDGAA
jgi:hypothetical protein